jgi:hypothetical protein
MDQAEMDRAQRMEGILEALFGRSPLRGSGLRPFGVEPPNASQAKPLVPNAERGA